MPDLYRVFGNPIAHSKSPIIHALFAAQTKQDLIYEAFCAPLTGFAESLQDFHQIGGMGANVTVPFKLDAFAACESLSDFARQAGAVNTLIRTKTGWRGDNTDGLGLVRALKQHGLITLDHKKILILGAGGAVRGVLPALLHEQPAAIYVANRTLATAQQLADHFTHFFPLNPIQALSIENMNDSMLEFDVIINGSSGDLHGESLGLSPTLLKNGGAAYHMMYGAAAVGFLTWARNQGAAYVSDGLTMLVEQAAESFALWRGIRPDTHAVLAQLNTH